jgi:hypothetical protein
MLLLFTGLLSITQQLQASQQLQPKWNFSAQGGVLNCPNEKCYCVGGDWTLTSMPTQVPGLMLEKVWSKPPSAPSAPDSSLQSSCISQVQLLQLLPPLPLPPVPPLLMPVGTKASLQARIHPCALPGTGPTHHEPPTGDHGECLLLLPLLAVLLLLLPSLLPSLLLLPSPSPSSLMPLQL